MTNARGRLLATVGSLKLKMEDHAYSRGHVTVAKEAKAKDFGFPLPFPLPLAFPRTSVTSTDLLTLLTEKIM